MKKHNRCAAARGYTWLGCEEESAFLTVDRWRCRAGHEFEAYEETEDIDALNVSDDGLPLCPVCRGGRPRQARTSNPLKTRPNTSRSRKRPH